ncbi:hypothetical protein AB0K12_36295 [Nonomuraea sp. NPDC049419]|uniref:hypothetical protein n=1 Tax=Nonomuraea sp. NPDC049419 TaxID=3155772 RepID=UPI003447427F
MEVATGRRWTYAEFDAAVNEVALGLLARGMGRHLGAELRRMGAHAVRHRQDRRIVVVGRIKDVTLRGGETISGRGQMARVRHMLPARVPPLSATPQASAGA